MMTNDKGRYVVTYLSYLRGVESFAFRYFRSAKKARDFAALVNGTVEGI